MNDFYKDFLYNKDQVSILEKAYKGIFDILNAQVREVDRNSIVSKILTYKTIRFQRIDVTSVMYTINSLLNNTTLLTSIGISPHLSFDAKREMWDNMSKTEKANLLDIAGYSIILTSVIKLPDNNKTEVMNYDIIDFELCDMTNNPFVLDVDYVFRDNKIILLKEFSLDDAYQRKFLILKNIVVDANVSENKLGLPLDIPFCEDFTKPDYNETMKGFIEAAAGGPTISKLETSLGKYKSLEDIKIIDKYNATIDKKFWSYNQTIKDYTSNDFVISMPVSFLYKSEKLQYIRKFFSEIKPAHTNFIFSPKLIISDILNLKYMEDVVNLTTLMKIDGNDKLNYSDSQQLLQGLTLYDGWEVYRKDGKCPTWLDGELYADSDSAECDKMVMNDSEVIMTSVKVLREILEYKESFEKFTLGLNITDVCDYYYSRGIYTDEDRYYDETIDDTHLDFVIGFDETKKDVVLEITEKNISNANLDNEFYVDGENYCDAASFTDTEISIETISKLKDNLTSQNWIKSDLDLAVQDIFNINNKSPEYYFDENAECDGDCNCDSIDPKDTLDLILDLKIADVYESNKVTDNNMSFDGEDLADQISLTDNGLNMTSVAIILDNINPQEEIKSSISIEIGDILNTNQILKDLYFDNNTDFDNSNYCDKIDTRDTAKLSLGLMVLDRCYTNKNIDRDSIFDGEDYCDMIVMNDTIELKFIPKS